MSAHDSWDEGNARYLAAATACLRLRLERLAKGDDAESEAMDDEAIGQAEQERLLCESRMAPPPALASLAQRLGLSPLEKWLLLLCTAMELDTRIAEHCARAQGDALRPHPTFALALALFPDAA